MSSLSETKDLEQSKCCRFPYTRVAGAEDAPVHVVHPLARQAERYRARDAREATAIADSRSCEVLLSASAKARVFVTHTRPEPFSGLIRPLDTGFATQALGYVNHGGTLDMAGMLFAPRCSWTHAVLAVAEVTHRPAAQLLTQEELEVVQGEGNLRVVM